MRTAHNTNDGRGALRVSRNALRDSLQPSTLRLTTLHRSSLRLITHYRRTLQSPPSANPSKAQPLAVPPSTAVQPSTP